MRALNVYLCGVGGQGIGLLSDVLSHACQAAGHFVRGCDTHGLAQRGGVVISHLRLGDRIFTPRVPAGEAGLIVSLERLEALRAAVSLLAPSGTVVYYDTVYQPIHVRLGTTPYPTADDLAACVAHKNGRLERVFVPDLPDPRMQNIALLGRLGALRAIDGVGTPELERSLRHILPPHLLPDNLALFLRLAQ